MKKHFFTLTIITFAGIFIFNSCKKETSCEGCRENNKPPIAVAGPGQVITLPTDSVSLDGSASNDPDGMISAWLWKKISGPASFNITNSAAAKSIVRDLTAGTYLYELTVTDNKGLSAKDTMQVIVNDPSQPNRPPVANAGADQAIALPTNIAAIDGRGSADPDNNIATYLWTKISGPASFNIPNANTVTTQVNNLVEGVYQFELKVTDAGGLFDKDTLRIIVNAEETVLVCGNENRPTVNAQLISTGTLSEPRSWISVAAAGDKILFNGGLGLPADCTGSNKVDMYDIANNTWSASERPWASSISGSGDFGMAVAVAGSKVFFAGGDNLMGCTDWYGRISLTYDAATNQWDSLDNSPVLGLGIAGASVGNKILFAGGTQGGYGNSITQEVSIYNLSTNSWSSASLSEGRHGGHAAIAVNNNVYIIGGEGLNAFSSTMDIYDNVSNAWSTLSLQKARAYFGAIAVNNKLYVAGGRKQSGDNSAICEVEIIDLNTGTSVIEYLSRPAKWYMNLGQNIVLKDNKIIFLRFDGGTDADKFDIYDINTNTWSIGVLPQAIPEDASVFSVNNTVFVAGGFVNGVLSNQVWKLEF
ncbi:MAG TPA: kelch repeat-containing protein [Chitinophagaceae bacterium]